MKTPINSFISGHRSPVHASILRPGVPAVSLWLQERQ